MSAAAPGYPQGATPAYTLFDARAIGLATLFGSPAAGTSLLALNYRRMGQKRSAVIALVLGLIATAVLLLLGWTLPHSATSALGLICLMAVTRSARSLQGAAVNEHLEHGGKLGSPWLAFGWGAVIFALLFGFVFWTASGQLTNGPKVLIGSKDEVHYSGSATKEEALALGNALKSSGYFTDRGVTVFLSKGKDGTTLSFVVKDGTWDQPNILSMFEEVVREVAPTVGGLPIKIRLTNAEKDVKKESALGSAVFAGGDTVYYSGTATLEEAKALGQSLQSAGYLGGKGADVFLSKGSDGTALSFVISNGAWNDAANVSNFETIVRGTASSVGGLPIKLRLVDTSLAVQKEVAVN